jgi:hypothetical protein
MVIIFFKNGLAWDVFGDSIKNSDYPDHYFFGFGINNPNTNLYYQLTHSNLNGFYKLTDKDIFNKPKPQYMSNYFYFINNELIFEFINNKKRKWLYF